MTSTIDIAACIGAESQPVPEFRIAILYETKALGIAAMRLCERLTKRFEEALLFHVAVESFQSLEFEERFNESLSAAAGSNMILVGSAGGFPASLRRWLAGSMKGRQEDAPVALVDLTAEDAANAEKIHHFLQEVAETNRFDLISREQFSAAASATANTPVPHAAQNRRHWGINE
jgi:hypothetical protein